MLSTVVMIRGLAAQRGGESREAAQRGDGRGEVAAKAAKD
jgi:hypothetical protein